jgi:hypothetical protein
LLETGRSGEHEHVGPARRILGDNAHGGIASSSTALSDRVLALTEPATGVSQLNFPLLHRTTAAIY